MRGLPEAWMHPQDQLFDRLRGPAKELHMPATAYSAAENDSTRCHEPMLFTVGFGRGRVFHTTLGHHVEGLAGLGFQITFARGADWAGTGNVTIPLPEDMELAVDEGVTRELVASRGWANRGSGIRRARRPAPAVPDFMPRGPRSQRFPATAGRAGRHG